MISRRLKSTTNQRKTKQQTIINSIFYWRNKSYFL